MFLPGEIEESSLQCSMKTKEGHLGAGKWDWQWNTDGYEVISDVLNSVNPSNCRFKPGVRMPIAFLSQVPQFNTILQVCC